MILEFIISALAMVQGYEWVMLYHTIREVTWY